MYCQSGYERTIDEYELAAEDRLATDDDSAQALNSAQSER